MCRFVVICDWNQQVGKLSSGAGLFAFWIFPFIAGSCKAGTIHVCVGPCGYGLATFLKGCVSCRIRLVDIRLCSPRLVCSCAWVLQIGSCSLCAGHDSNGIAHAAPWLRMHGTGAACIKPCKSWLLSSSAQRSLGWICTVCSGFNATGSTTAVAWGHLVRRLCTACGFCTSWLPSSVEELYLCRAFLVSVGLGSVRTIYVCFSLCSTGLFAVIAWCIMIRTSTANARGRKPGFTTFLKRLCQV